MKNLANGLRWLLWPLSVVYQAITWLRNYLYDHRLFKVYQSFIFTINVGNLTVGGTGKTPHIAYLAHYLTNDYPLAVLSRGYGRKTNGFLRATAQSTAQEIGDEPLQLFQHFDQKIPVVVCEKRALGLQQIAQQIPQTQVVLLDDAFQHRAVLPHLNILLTDFKRLFYEDFILPTGRLREARTEARRAHAVIVSKCPPQLFESKKFEIQTQIQKYTLQNVPVFFSTFQYGAPRAYFGHQPAWPNHNTCLLVSGIAQPALFEEAARQRFKVINHLIFADHYQFVGNDLDKIKRKANNNAILTTEKDFVKLKPLLENTTFALHFYYLPIEVKFLQSPSVNFDNWFKQQLNTVFEK